MPVVVESLTNYITPIIKNLDGNKLEDLGFKIPFDNENNIVGLQIEPLYQRKIEKDMVHYEGSIFIQGESKYFNEWIPYYLNMNFCKLSKNDSWKLIKYNGYVDKYKSLTERDIDKRLPPEVHVYLKSMFETIDQDECWENLDKFDAIIKAKSIDKVKKKTP